MAYQPKSYRKFVATAATATLVASAFAPVASAATADASKFKDVASKYKDAVEFVVSKGAVGTSETTFGTDANIKRGDAAVLLVNVLGLDIEKAPASGFKDVNTRLAKHINALKAAGITTGKTETTFDPDAKITRGELAIWIVRAFELEGTTSKEFEDVNTVYKPYVSALVANEITKGATEKTFGTTANAKRGDYAIFLHKASQVDPAPSVVDITRVDDATLTLKIQGEVKEVKASDFAFDNGLEVKEAKIVPAPATGAAATLTYVQLTTSKQEPGKTYKLTKALGKAVDAASAPSFQVPAIVAPEITSVKAVNSKTATVTFKGPVQEGVDFTNFDINGGLTVSAVQFSTDRKTATVTVSSEFTRNQEYTISVFGVKDAAGTEYPETAGKFSWEVAEGVTVALDSTTLDQGQEIGVSVKDLAGKDIKDAYVKVTSFNSNLVSVNEAGKVLPSEIEIKANTNKLAGTTDVVVETTLPDGSILNNTFKVTVKEAVSSIANAGFSLEKELDPTLANTVAFKNFADPTTSVVEGSGEYGLVAFAETNGNPDTKHIDFTGATRVVSSSPIVATAILEDDVVVVTPLTPGNTTVTVTMKDGSRKAFPITVTSAPYQKTISVNATSIKLSDENRKESQDAYHEGVDGQTFTITSLNQFDKKIAFKKGKVTVSSNTEGLQLFQGGTKLTANANEVDFSEGTDADVVVTSIKDTPVKNAKITVSYFANKTDAKPTTTKTITVDVNDIDPTAKTSAIDVVTATEIDANAHRVLGAVSSINFANVPVYALDSKGNRIEKLTGSASIAEKNKSDKYVTVDTNTIEFKELSNSLTYLRSSSTVDVVVEADNVLKVIPVTYKNTAVVPNKATVSTSPVSIKLNSADTNLSINDIVFGKADIVQLISDDALNASADDKTNIIAALKSAKNGGYLYNKPLVSVTGTDGKVLSTGVNVYGGTATGFNANTWNNDVLQALTGNTNIKYSSTDFELDYMIANVNDATSISEDGVVTPQNNKATTFTLVVKGIYASGSYSAIEGGTSASAKAKHNLLAAPVQLNVSVSK